MIGKKKSLGEFPDDLDKTAYVIGLILFSMLGSYLNVIVNNQNATRCHRM